MSDPSVPEKDRADRLLVALGHFPSRAAAQAAIAAGQVRADGRTVAKPSETLFRSAEIEAGAAHPYVSRGGLKLAHALDAFGTDPSGLTCLDLGASTGGFTDVLLRRGAAHVTAIDAGHSQLHPTIAADPRVTSLERLNARDLAPAHMKSPPQLIVCDLSFVSLAKVLAAPLALAGPQAILIALFKPQFEVGPAHVGKGGIVTDDDATARALAAFTQFLETEGWPPAPPIPSPVTGGDGNREYLVLARRP
ncbi:TlyA family RNA methyltransferase [Hyphomonas sp.]|uniref:TlyA family RNA methyltransferase n=1 Tax=Hyphomonas sp. TaxID=87 RepID=UPI00391CD548